MSNEIIPFDETKVLDTLPKRINALLGLLGKDKLPCTDIAHDLCECGGSMKDGCKDLFLTGSEVGYDVGFEDGCGVGFEAGKLVSMQDEERKLIIFTLVAGAAGIGLGVAISKFGAGLSKFGAALSKHHNDKAKAQVDRNDKNLSQTHTNTSEQEELCSENEKVGSTRSCNKK